MLPDPERDRTLIGQCRKISSLFAEDTTELHMKPTIHWKLEGAREVSSPEVFFDLLKTEGLLENITYLHDCLHGSEGERSVKGKKFVRVNFSKTEITGITFRDCEFSECLFIGARILDCKFHQCTFVSTNPHKVTISGTYINPASFANCLNTKLHQNIGLHLYQQLLKNSRDEDQIEFQREAQFLFYRWKRYQLGYEIKNRKTPKLCRRKIEHVGRWLWEKLLGSGVKLRYLIYTASTTVLLCALVNYCLRDCFGLELGKTLPQEIVGALYYTTVSLTTLGYGDVVPETSYGKAFAALQSVIGFFLFAMLASTLFRRVTP